MKASAILLASLVLMGLGTACTFVSQPKVGLGRVVLSAREAGHSGHSLLSRNVGPAKSLGRAALHRTPAEPSAAGRNLSAANDIVAMTYKVWDLDNVSSDPSAEGDINPYSLSAELALTPGGHYRIVVDVEIKSTAPGTNVGVKRYGDQADFWVDEYYDTYVDLTVHPTQALVFDAASVVAGSPATIAAFDPSLDTPAKVTRNFFGGSVTVSPADKLFYGPDADLFYFNKAANAVYRWPKIDTAINPSSNEVISGETAFDALDGWDPLDTTVQIYAVCSDPTYADYVWLVGQDQGGGDDDGEWFYYTYDLGSKVAWRSSPISTLLLWNTAADAAILTEAVPTGIAVDSTYHDVYITYYAYNKKKVIESSVMQFYNDSYYAQYPNPSTFEVPSGSIFTDVVWEQGKAWVSLSPNTTIPASNSDRDNRGVANIVQLDDYMNDLGLVAGKHTYSGTIPTLSASTSKLVLPNRFLGPIQGTTLYLSQQDFMGDGTGPAVLSALDLDTTDVVSY